MARVNIARIIHEITRRRTKRDLVRRRFEKLAIFRSRVAIRKSPCQSFRVSAYCRKNLTLRRLYESLTSFRSNVSGYCHGRRYPGKSRVTRVAASRAHATAEHQRKLAEDSFDDCKSADRRVESAKRRAATYCQSRDVVKDLRPGAIGAGLETASVGGDPRLHRG